MSNINDAINGVETALALIQEESGYNYSLGSSDFIGPENMDEVLGSMPRVYIVGYSDEVDRFSFNRLFRKLTVNIRGVTPGMNYRSQQDMIDKLWDDIETAMYSDKTLGGTVTTLRYVAGEVEYNRENSHGVLDLSFELDIHYAEGSP